ncbi:MAG TPA: NAD-dependent epimerase/dehydratase family protein [Solirubrobacteraceae bacterium]|jgi:nucleoside-diphosphate-sugar epimerase|nr:NAD-dependent epimerase/dehydratase family protein [Solirubrobacteraceae bacterium]
MKEILVTGAAGFIGSHLCEAQLAAGRTVHGIDSFSDHYARGCKELNLVGLLGHERFVFHELDIVEEPLDELVGAVECVFHLAARPGVRDSWNDFEDYARVNILGTRAVLDACATHRVRLVYASSSSVYGDAAELPVRETASPHPISPYGASKVMTEVLSGAYAQARGLEAVGLRYFTVYGPRQRPDMALARFIEAAVGGRELSIYGDGRQLRDFTYVHDVVAATIAAAEQGRAGAIYNIASSRPQPLLEVLDELSRAIGLELRTTFEDAKAGDVRDTWACTDLAREELGFQASTPLREGLTAQVQEAEQRRASPIPLSASPASR